MKILFMGTPDFAVKSLITLCEAHDVIGVITQPDKPRGRHMTLTPPAVKVAACERNIPVFQPNTLRDAAFAEILKSLSPDLIAVVAYGKILPKEVLAFPRLGCINLHGSLLPEYRGAAPMQRALIDGKSRTGVTTMYMAEGMDTGDMLEKAELPLTEEDNFETVHDKLSQIGAELLLSTVNKLEAGTLVPQKQDDALATYAKKIENEDCVIDFSKSADTIFNQIRGLSPFPLAYCRLNRRMLKIIDSRPVSFAEAQERFATPTPVNGQVLSLENGMIYVQCGQGVLAIRALLPEGKSRMKAADFINGHKIAVGDILE